MKLLTAAFISLCWMGIAKTQPLSIVTRDNSRIEVLIVSDTSKQQLLREFDGKLDNTIRKQWTARTYRLSDKRILVEFYDRQAVLIRNETEFRKLDEVRFTKNYIDFLKKNITYQISFSFGEGLQLAKQAKKIDTLKSEMPEYFNFEVFELPSRQILFINKSQQHKSATIYENIKGLASDNNDVLNQYYQGMEKWAQQLINGDPMLDFEPNEQLVYPADIGALIVNHQLSLIERKVYVRDFYGNLYQSAKGYYVLIDEVNQKNGAGNKMSILTVRLYPSLREVRLAQAKYRESKTKIPQSEHFYKKISDTYGNNFSSVASALIDKLPGLLNFDHEQLTFDSTGMAIADEAIHWNHADYGSFDKWYPGILAYYGQCYIAAKKDGKWVVKKEKDYDVLIPHLVLSDNTDAFDVYDFYKDLSEWPTPLKLAGDWDGDRKKMRAMLKAMNK